MSTNQKYLVVAASIIVLATVFGFLTIHNKHKSPSYLQVTTNRDTGQTIISTPNQGPEKGSGSNTVTILGSNKFLSAGMTQAQFTLTQNLISQYVHEQLQGRYSQVAILNDGFSSTGRTITARMRLGSSQTLLNLTIAYHDLIYVSLTINNPSDASYNYKSGEQTVPAAQQSQSSGGE